MKQFIKQCVVVVEWIFKRLLLGLLLSLLVCVFGVVLGFKPDTQREQIIERIEQPAEASESYGAFGKLTPELMRHICSVANSYNINCNVALAIAQQETGGDPWLQSGAGAIGLMQVMPQTAKLICKDVKKPQMLWDARLNIECGLQVLEYCLKTYKGDLWKALYCYNGSPACQEKCRTDGKAIVCVNHCEETYKYARSVVSRINNIKREG